MVNASPDKETGGCLFGSYDRDHNSIYVYYMKPAPEDSIHTSVSFVRGFKGLTDEYKRITKLTYNQVRYLESGIHTPMHLILLVTQTRSSLKN